MTMHFLFSSLPCTLIYSVIFVFFSYLLLYNAKCRPGQMNPYLMRTITGHLTSSEIEGKLGRDVGVEVDFLFFFFFSK